MATIGLGQNQVETIGNLPDIGSKAPEFTLVKSDLTSVSLSDFQGKRVVMNIFPSVDTGTCSKSVRKFNQEAAKLQNTVVLCISRDLPFAQARFCGAEGIENVILLSDFREGKFGEDYKVAFKNGGFKGLLSRSVVVLDENFNVIYTQQVQNTGDEPDYENALEALNNG